MPTPSAQPAAPAVTLGVVALIYCGIGAWGLTSALGLLLMRNWARLSFLIFSGLLAVVSVCAAASLLLGAFVVPTASLAPNVNEQVVRATFAAVTIMSLAGLGIAVWWLVYFNRSTVKASFIGADVAPRPSNRLPLTVSIISVLLVAGGALTAIQTPFPRPVLLFGVVLRGLPGSLALAVFAAISVTAGTGMLKRRVEAHSLAVGLVGAGILNILSLILLPGSAARVHDLMAETQGTPSLSAEQLRDVTVFATILGAAMLGTMLFLLLRARKPFVDACRAHVD